MKKLSWLFIALIVLQSCATTTVITSNVPEAEVYINGKYKGTTPYAHRDKLPMGAQRKIELKKEGYETYNTKIDKFDRFNGMAFFMGFVIVAPWLWSGTYKHYYQYEMLPTGQTTAQKSDFLEYGEVFKTEKGYYSIYIGEDTAGHYFYNQGNVHILDKNMQHKETFDLNIKMYGKPIDAYMDGPDKKVVLFDEEKKRVLHLNIDTLRRSQLKTYDKAILRPSVVDDEYQFGYHRNKSTNMFICYSKNALFARHPHGRRADKYERQHGQIVEARILEDDRVLILERSAGGKPFLIELKDGEFKTLNIAEEDMPKWSHPRLSVNEETGKAYVSGFALKKQKKEIFMDGAFVSTIDLNTSEEESFKRLDLGSDDDDQYLINRGVISDGENEILCLEQQVLVIVTTSSSGGGGSSVSTSEKLITGSMVMANFTEEETKVKWVEKKIMSGYHRPKLGTHLILKNGKLYCFYNNQINGRTFAVQSVFDTQMNYLSVNYRDNYKEDGALFHPRTAVSTEDGDYVFIMQYKKKLGMVKAKLE